MQNNLSEQIAALPGMERTKLIQLWNENFSQAPPPAMRKDLMVPILAYRIQEKELGGLSQSARRKLREIAQASRSKKHLRTDSALKKGARLVRMWKGELHEVNVSDDGFEYRGQRFDNLSRIATEITGTRWSGPLFFGTRQAS